MMKRECRAAAKNERDHCWSFDRTSLGLSRAMMVELYRLSIIYIYISIIDIIDYRLSIHSHFSAVGSVEKSRHWTQKKHSRTTQHDTARCQLN